MASSSCHVHSCLLVIFHRLVWHLAAHGRCTLRSIRQFVCDSSYACIYNYRFACRLEQESGWRFSLDTSVWMLSLLSFVGIFVACWYLHFKLGTLRSQQYGITSRYSKPVLGRACENYLRFLQRNILCELFCVVSSADTRHVDILDEQLFRNHSSGGDYPLPLPTWFV